MSSLELEGSLDALNEGVQVVAPDWRYLYVNEAAARQGRKSRSDLIGKTMQACYPGIDGTPMFERLARCMRDRRSDALENEFAFENGSKAWFELRIHPCPAGLVLLSLDMTERKSVESRLQQAYQQALRDLVTPVIRVHPGVLLVPLIGAQDLERAARTSEGLLKRVADENVKVVIFDVAGVPELDTAVANQLLQVTAMVRLLGASAVLTGLMPEAARVLVQLGVDLSAMHTRSQLADGLILALGLIGRVIVDRSPAAAPPKR